MTRTRMDKNVEWALVALGTPSLPPERHNLARAVVVDALRPKQRGSTLAERASIDASRATRKILGNVVLSKKDIMQALKTRGMEIDDDK